MIILNNLFKKLNGCNNFIYFLPQGFVGYHNYGMNPWIQDIN